MITPNEFEKCLEQVLDQFLSSIGYKITKKNDFYVEYESKGLLINISYDFRDGEVSVYIGLLSKEINVFDFDKEFSLYDLLEEISSSENYNRGIVRREEELKLEMGKILSILQGPGKSILLNPKKEIFSRVAKKRKDLRKKETRDDQTRNIKEDAERAFIEKDYALSVRLYKKIESDLDQIDKKRYEFAKKKLTEATGSGTA